MEKLIIIKTLSQLAQLKAYIEQSQYIAFDVETTGVDKESKIIGFSVSADANTGYYVVLSYWDIEEKAMKDLETLAEAKKILSLLVGKDLVMHNAPFDCYMVENNFQISLISSVHTDTLVLGHLLNENRSNGLKELGVSIFGEDAKAEQIAMKESVHKNGGLLTKDHYELYKGDADLIAKYGAKDAVLTIKLFYLFVLDLHEQGLEDFFYNEESMPLLKGPTYDLNTTGLKIDSDKLSSLKATLEVECMEWETYIHKETEAYTKDQFKTFNPNSSEQLAWLLFIKLGNDFNKLTDTGREICKFLNLKLPYSYKARQQFISEVNAAKGRVYKQGDIDKKTGKRKKDKTVGAPWKYLSTDVSSIKPLASKYKWVQKLLELNKNKKLLSTYVEGIQSRMKYGIIRPSFLQHGTTSGRYSSRNPNFQNLPRDDKRVKSCIIARPGKVFIGADYSQLEPRVFASFSGDVRLLSCFTNGDDFYSVIGTEVFDKYDCNLKKDDPRSFAIQYPKLRNIAKVIALSATYGTTAPKMASALGKRTDEAQEIIDNYFEKFPSVRKMMLESHEMAKKNGFVKNLFGRPRRMPAAKDFKAIFGNSEHDELPYEARNLLNLAVNHRIQSTGASIINRAMIKFHNKINETGIKSCKIVMQIHDELVVECNEADATTVSLILKDCMENTVILPGVKLEAKPIIAKNLAELK